MDVKLVMFKKDGQRKDFAITNKTTIVGRSEECNLRIPLLSISRQHCELVKTDDELQVRDLASSNGTYVNNHRVNEKVLKAGDRIAIGPMIFTVQIDGQPEEVAPVKTRATKAPPLPTSEEEEEIIDLEAGGSDEEFDPISALEALATDTEEEQKD